MTNFLVTIDTEEEREWGSEYKDHTHYTVENIKWLDPLQKVFDKHGVKATYLIDYPVVINKDAVNILKNYKDNHNAEIGTHLHPWVNPPYEEEASVVNSLTHNLPIELQFKKMEVLTNAIADAMHEKPCTYRAGRYGFDSTTIKVLEDLDYTVDTSVVPFREAKQSYEASFGYLNSIEPYRLDYNDIMKSGQSKLLEVPLSVGFNRKVPAILEANYNGLPNIGIRRVLSKVLDIDMFWLRPSYANLHQMKQVSSTFIKKGISFLNMMFHSNELMPNGSKYCKTEEDVNRYLKQLDDYFTWLNKNYSINFVTLKETPSIYNT
ncbi:MAG: hypothetical protein D8M58_13110 [Calditrichaeota bacterium]|nr:MAG: hypothetical protein DWQ03_13895 [Calditrichota bacterium]MBL1206339.1 hypothetical protein [Calditrichota bacterium]NOG46165.1 hypothetical protein [Calditrichota bacterium]